MLHAVIENPAWIRICITHYESKDLIAANLVGNSANSTILNGFAGEKNRLDFHRCNVLTATTNDVLAPIDKKQ